MTPSPDKPRRPQPYLSLAAFVSLLALYIWNHRVLLGALLPR